MYEFLRVLAKDFYPIESTVFFSASKVKEFIQNHKDTSKNILLTHLSEILKATAFHLQDDTRVLFLTSENFGLSRIPSLATLSAGNKKKKSSNSNRGSIVTFEDIRKMVRDHKNFDHSVASCPSFTCRAIFMSLTGLRFINTYKWRSNSEILKKKCSCRSTCDILTRDCFDRIKILRTKNGDPINLPIIPQIHNCMKYVATGDESCSYQVAYDGFSAYMKDRFGCTPHKLRQVLPNLIADFNNTLNTGGWKSNQVMHGSYVGTEAKYAFAFLSLKRDEV